MMMMMMDDDEGEIIIPMKDPYHPSTITAVDGGKGSPGPLPTRRREIEFVLTAEHTAAAKVNKDNDDNAAASATNE